MSKTKISGSRIRFQTILLEHFTPTLKIPESMLDLVYPTHLHTNKNILDRIRYTGTKENVDLRDIELLTLEVVSARRDGKNLGGTIDDKADKSVVDALITEIAIARGVHGTLLDSIRQYGIEVDTKLSNHIGSVGHDELDVMYHDYIASKGGQISLAERLNNLGTGSGTGSGNTVIETINPWTYKHTIGKDASDNIIRTVTIPYRYTPNTNSIQVFEGPLMMLAGSTNDYIEVDSSTIRFNYDIPEGSIITIQGVSQGTLFLWSQTFRSNLNQRYFRLLDNYRPGTNDLVVYESGLLMTEGIDYNETGNDSISFLYPLPEGVQVTVSRRR